MWKVPTEKYEQDYGEKIRRNRHSQTTTFQLPAVADKQNRPLMIGAANPSNNSIAKTPPNVNPLDMLLESKKQKQQNLARLKDKGQNAPQQEKVWTTTTDKRFSSVELSRPDYDAIISEYRNDTSDVFRSSRVVSPQQARAQEAFNATQNAIKDMRKKAINQIRVLSPTCLKHSPDVSGAQMHAKKIGFGRINRNRSGNL